MRRWILISVLALAGCGEHQGWNPNYKFRSSNYGTYLAEREVALMTGSNAPQTIPVVRPVKGLSPEEIAGTSPVPIPATMRIRKRVEAPASPATASQPVQYGSYQPPALAR